MVKIIVLSIIVLFCLILSGYFSCLDMAYSSANRHYLEREAKNKKRAKIALKYCLEYDKTITTVIFSNNLVNIASSSISAILGIILFKDIFNLVNMDEFLINTITSATLTILIIGFGEVLPKAIGRLYAEKVAIGSVYFVKFIQILFFPFVFVTTKLADIVARPILKKKHKYDDEEITNEELTEMVDQIEESGQIDEEHGDLIRSAIILKETEAHEIMTPRVDVFFFDVEDDINELLNSEEIYMYSRIPVYEETVDNIIGILPTKAILKAMLMKKEINVRDYLVKEINVPSGMSITSILELFKKTHNHIAIVKDEYGGTDGVITMEDIVEELVGEIYDEQDEIEEEDIQKISRNTYVVDGYLNIEDFFNYFNLEEDEVDTDYDSVGGWCIDTLEKFGKVNDTFKYKNLVIRILKASEFTIDKIEVKVTKKK